MCGIVGFIRMPDEDVVDDDTSDSVGPHAQEEPDSSEFCGKSFLFSALQKLTYRGYDSCGMALMYETSSGQHKIAVQKSAGKVHRLSPLLDFLPGDSHVGIAHTRWATHGPPTSMNAHPHRHRGIALVHNGIVENSHVLRDQLDHRTYLSDTDSEVVLWTIHHYLKESSWEEAMMRLAESCEGSYTMAIMDQTQPDKMFVTKYGSPLVVGFGDVGGFCASDVSAIDGVAHRLLFLEDGDVGVLRSSSFEFLVGDRGQKQLKNKTQKISSDDPADQSFFTAISGASESYDKGEYPHYMLKEITEQPRVLAGIIDRCVDLDQQRIREDELGLTKIDLNRVREVHFIGCGSAYYASLIGSLAMEAYGVLPCRVSQASEYRYGSVVITPYTLVIAVSQSGETADTLGCVRHALSRGAQVLSICNVRYSSLCRISTASVLMGAQTEVAVASTKAFTAQVLWLFLMACHIHSRRRFPALSGLFGDLSCLSQAVQHVLSPEIKQIIQHWGQQISTQKSCLFIGRHVNAAVAFEGALKLKEITYIHAEAYPAGELKHGPLALVDSHMMMMAIAPQDHHYPKMLSNIEEVCARGARVFLVTTGEDLKLRSLCHEVISVPDLISPYLQSILCTVVLQLVAYYSAVNLGYDVDQPRNLAKSVTVE